MSKVFLNSKGVKVENSYLVKTEGNMVPVYHKEFVEAQLAADLAEAINKASQAENDVPTVSFYNDAEVIDVDYS